MGALWVSSWMERWSSATSWQIVVRSLSRSFWGFWELVSSWVKSSDFVQPFHSVEVWLEAETWLLLGGTKLWDWTFPFCPSSWVKWLEHHKSLTFQALPFIGAMEEEEEKKKKDLALFLYKGQILEVSALWFFSEDNFNHLTRAFILLYRQHSLLVLCWNLQLRFIYFLPHLFSPGNEFLSRTGL